MVRTVIVRKAGVLMNFVLCDWILMDEKIRLDIATRATYLIFSCAIEKIKIHLVGLLGNWLLVEGRSTRNLLCYIVEYSFFSVIQDCMMVLGIIQSHHLRWQHNLALMKICCKTDLRRQ